MKRMLAVAVLAVGGLAVFPGAASADFQCHETAKGNVCAGNRRTDGGGAVSNAGASGTNRNGYFESGRGGGCGYHFEFNPGPEPDKYVGQC
jgi:hypothetical protein